MSYLYVNEQGSTLSVEEGYFLVRMKNGMLKKIPKETLESVVVFGNVQMTTQFMSEVLRRGIRTSIFSTKGHYFGRIESTLHPNIERLKKQIHCVEQPEFALRMAKKILKAKVHNQQVLIRRYSKKNPERMEERIRYIGTIHDKIDGCSTIDQAVGYEGIAARTYFECLSNLVLPEFSFSGRNRRPPKDAFNSMLSLGYTLLMYEIFGEIVSRGLSPYAGFMHQDRISHPTLASDMMEEWRPVIVDAVVMSLIQGREIDIGEFEKDTETGGIYIKEEGMKAFLRKFEAKLRSDANYLELDSSSTNFRRAFWLQSAAMLRAVEEENADQYRPVRIR